MSSIRFLPLAILAAFATLSTFAAHAQTLTTLYSFASGSDGAAPSGPLLYLGGALFGTTRYGGGKGCATRSGCGTVFRLDLRTGLETVLGVFSGQPTGSRPNGLVLDDAGNGYGTTISGGTINRGTVFKMNRNGAMTVLHSFAGGSDSGRPGAGLIFLDGMLYGTTGLVGKSSLGTVFRIDPATGAETVLHNFAGGSTDGAVPD